MTTAPAIVGINHVHLKVSDIARSVRFYEDGLGFHVGLAVHDDQMVFLQTSGGADLLTLSTSALPNEVDPGVEQPIGSNGGIDHFGIRVADANAFAQALESVVAAGATVISQSEIMGAPTMFVTDPDGYAIQIYVMPPTPPTP